MTQANAGIHDPTSVLNTDLSHTKIDQSRSLHYGWSEVAKRVAFTIFVL